MTAPKDIKLPRARTDWDAVERDYRTGLFTFRELGEKHGADYSLISRRAKKYEWSQDLSIAIKQATNTKLTEALVCAEVHKEQQKVHTTVDAAAEVNVRVIMGHRTGLQQITRVKGLLLGQIEQAVTLMPDLAEVIEMVRNPDENGRDRANDLLRAAMERGALVDDLKKLTEVDERVRKGEREAFNLNTATPEVEGVSGASMTDAERAVRLSRLINGSPAVMAAFMAMRNKPAE